MISYNDEELTLHTIHRFLSVLLRNHSHDLYEQDRTQAEVQDMLKKKRKKGIFSVHINKDQMGFDDAYSELFLWSVLCNKKVLMDFFWTHCRSPLLMAEMAASIYIRLAAFYAQFQEHPPLEELR